MIEFLAASSAAALLGLGRGGFAGIGQLGTPILALLMPPLQAVTILLPVMLVQDAYGIWAYRKDCDIFYILDVSLGLVIGLVLALLFAAYVNNNVVRVVVGSVVLVQMVTKTENTWVVGILAGFAGLLINAAAAPFMAYLQLQKEITPAIYMGTLVVFFAVIDVLKVPPLIALGQFNTETLTASAYLIPVGVGAIFVGKRFTQRMSKKTFENMSKLLLIGVAIALIMQGVVG